MDSYPNRDLLTINENPPPLIIRTACKIAFALICHPIAYGTKLHDEMVAKGTSHEYLATRNAVILRRECLRMDYLNPNINQRTQYLKSVTKLLSSLNELDDTSVIARKYCEFFTRCSESANNALWTMTADIKTVNQYLDLNGPRLSLALGHNSSNSSTARSLSDYEASIATLAKQLINTTSTLRSVLLNESVYSCVTIISKDDRKTRFFPTLTTREKSLIQSNLTSLGADFSNEKLTQSENDHFQEHWTSQILISLDELKSLTPQEEENEFNHFKKIEPSPTLRAELSNLRLPTPEVTLATLMMSRYPPSQSPIDLDPFAPPQPCPKHDELILAERPMTYRANSPQLLTQQKQATTDQQTPLTAPDAPDRTTGLEEYLPTGSEFNRMLDYITHNAKYLSGKLNTELLLTQNARRFLFTRRRASDCPDKHPPGDVVHVSVTSRDKQIDGITDLYVKRFTISDTNDVTLFLTRQNQLQTIFEVANTAIAVKFLITRGTLKESVEITKSKTNLWFYSKLD